MESLVKSAWAGRRVLVTGQTGFKGAWLCEWLLGLGAEVHGWALPPLAPSLFASLNLEKRMHHREGDLLDFDALKKYVAELEPQFIFHLAAQALVRVSYRQPRETFLTNVAGTMNVLEAVWLSGPLPCTVVAITTDKCYENDGRPRAFRETDPLGGHDPYSASKAGAELVIGSYRDSYFRDGKVALASARAGNVIGGGDWAEDRLVPDAIRALQAGKPVPIRNPGFTRPWQHVLEPLGGYLSLAAKLEKARQGGDVAEIARYAQPFNFGPTPDANRTVQELVEEVLRHWPGNQGWEKIGQEAHLPEAPVLSLAIDKARQTLGWSPRWDFTRTVQETVAWYREAKERGGQSMIDFTQQQIAGYDQKSCS